MSDKKTVSMKATFSINGFRSSLSRNLDELREMAEEFSETDRIDDKELFVELVNDLIYQSNIFNCTYHTEIEDFDDMSDTHIEFVGGDNDQ